MNTNPTTSMPSRAITRGYSLPLLVATAALAVTTVRADINTLNRTVWKMQFGVTDAQLGDANWLAADSDGDGISNGTEVAAGTNPFSAGSVVKITSITADEFNVSLTFPVLKGKQYVVQGAPNLTSFAALSPSVTYVWNPTFLTPAPGLPASVMLTAPKGTNKFFRVLVQDLDSDSDGVSDWAEYVVGYKPNDATTIGTTPDGDAAGLVADLALENQVSITATDSIALQPEGGNAAVDVGQVSINRTGSLRFTSITVPLAKSGTAVEGSDYALLPTSVTLPAHTASVAVNVTPTANSGLKTNRVATVSVLPGGGYTLAGPSSASVAINPAGTANGTGLTAVYHNTASSTYSSQTTIFSGAVEMSRTDTTVNFSTGVNGWGAVGGPTGLSSASTNGAFSVRWTGQILPQYSEKYTIDFRSDDGAKVWVNGMLLIDRWVTQSANDYVNTIDLKAGTLYDIQIEYFNNATGSAEAKLYWWSPSQVKQIIPQARLFPAPAQSAKFTAVTSEIAAVGYVGVPFSFYVTSPNIGGTTTYALGGGSLPPGLALNASTGLISGPPTTAGTYNVAINATNSAAGSVTGSSVIDFTIWPTGSVTREVGANYAADSPATIPALDDDTDYADNTVRRLRGYIVPPKTGNYYFWLAASNTAEFWLSNDSESVNAVRRASVTATTGKKTWNALASQQSQWISLVAGKRYYFEVLHNTGVVGDDHVSLGWLQDDVGTVISTTASPNPTGVTPLIPNGGGALQGYPLSGTAPSYIFQPYDYPTVAAATGVLYAANLGPQGSATTQASGSSNLRVDFANNTAVLHFSYSGLSSARTNYHLHTDAFESHPAGEIVYDIDDIDSFHPDLRTPDGGYIWDFAPVGTFTTVQQIKDAIIAGKIYLNIHTVNYAGGEIRGNLTVVDGSQTPPDPALYGEPAATDLASNTANAARFLNQATFGASTTEVANVGSLGFSGWIDNQLTKPASRSSNDVVAGISADINQPYPSALFTNAWWKYSITGQDQLRQRLAFALSEIMVVSWANDSGPLAFNGRILADYYDQLVDYCLPTAGLTDSGNFRGILKQVTLTPAMGLYLDMRANQKGDDSTGLHPNENYAREIMQLFSVGLNRMWDDGRFVIDSNANLVPTYLQPTILGLSALLTGWNYAQPLQASGRLPTNFGPGADYLNPMVLVPQRHEYRYSKLLLNNIVSPAATGVTPRVNIGGIATGNPCTVTTQTMHGLKPGDTVAISGVTGGQFGVPASGPSTANIIATHAVVAVPSATTFTVAINCSAAAAAAGTVTGAKVTPVTYTQTSGIAVVTGSQGDNAGSTVPHPYDQYGLTELERAIDNIVNNDNVPPYICRQLIQRLVTSDPSPGYVYRVVQKFKNNGSGVRGDLVAVIKQILLDGEARSTSAAYASTTFGKQREPLLRVTGPARAFPSVPYTGTYTQLTGINSNKFRITTSIANDFSPGFSFALKFSNTVPNAYQNPTSTTYSVASTQGIAATHTDIATIGTGNPTVITTMQPHGLATGNTVTMSGLSGSFASTVNGTFTATVLDATSFSIPVNTTRVFQVASVSLGNPCTVTTVSPHGLAAGTTAGVTLNGINGGTFSTSINGTTLRATNTGANTFTVATSASVAINCTLVPTSYTTWRHVSNPCRVTTVGAHNLNNGDTITISGISGGTFSPSISNTFAVTVVDPTSFTVPVNCTAPSNINTGSIVGGTTLDVTATGMVNVTYTQPAGSNVMTVNTTGPQTDVTIPVPNSATTTLKSRVYLAPVTVASSVSISSIATGNPCTITTAQNHGLTTGNTVTFSGLTTGAFSPAINNNSFSVTVVSANTFRVASNCTTAPTAATGTITGSWIAMPGSAIYDVQANVGSTFTVTTADTPAGPRSGNVIIPKIATSYSPQSSNTIVQYNNNVNHNMLVGDHVWVDVPVIGSPVTDAEYVITETADEDHFKTSYLPVSSGLGTYPKPSGANNGITIWPLVPPPTGRSGDVSINQSTFAIGSTESALSQSPLNAPTVFNYFFPDYKFPGSLSNSGIDSPEFQLSTDTNISNLTNSVTNMFIGTGGGNGNVNGLSSFNNGSGSVVFDIGPYLSSAADGSISGLIDTLAGLLVGAPLDASTKTTIQNFVTYKRTITNISQQSPCVITTSAAHGLAVGQQIAINEVSGGSYSGGSINGALKVTEVVSPTTFKVGTAVTVPVAINCTNNTTINYTNANVSNFPMNNLAPGATNLQKRDRVRAIIHLILTSAEYAVQK